jgi:hypothetical protein
VNIPPLSLGRVRKQKYGNVRCELDGFKFDSKAEMRHYAGNLKIRQMAGEIESLQVHPRYPLNVNGIEVGVYEADFVYTDRRTGVLHVVDVKGGRATNTPLSQLKQRIFAAQYGTKVEIVI